MNENLTMEQIIQEASEKNINQQQTNEISIAMYNKNYLKDHKFSMAFGAFGSAAGIGLAIYHKTGFWKGVGLWLLVGLVGSATGAGIDTLTKK